MNAMMFRMAYAACFRFTRPVAHCVLALGLAFASYAASSEKSASVPALSRSQAYAPGERLLYEISWSNVIKAGTAIMEVRADKLPNGKKVHRLVATSRSAGMVDKIYPVNDVVQSVIDPLTMQSLSFSLQESHGKRKRRRTLAFDHEARTVLSTLNDEPPKTLPIPERVQDALSSLYELRTRADFTIGKIHVIDVHDSGKTWSVEVHVLGREKVETLAGEFDTIKVKTFPRYEGVFMNKGEIFIWLTDDSRKVPVLMKSTISIGSIMTTLVSMEAGRYQP